jgi:Na+/H+ antiporter NhaD/arsenite permease-like protein
MILPFVCLLLCIALLPFINRHWWEKYYPAVTGVLGLTVVAYYAGGIDNPGRILASGIEYVSFICLIGSLFVVSGGIHIRIRGKSTPLANVFLLAIGAVVANLIGTTGASMVLIRPFLRVNRFRIHPYHVVFFIFIVSNMGGALTPIGDPPLFLGYLRGVPFFWVVEQVWGKWLLAMGVILGVFFVVDTISFRSLAKKVQHEVQGAEETGAVSGLQNIFFLAVILVAVFVTNPPFVREVLMVAAAAGSYLTTGREIHRQNDFNFVPLREVAILFAGIFATMVPALDWLQMNAASIGIRTPGEFFWASGGLSSFLDNAPTYVNFLSAQIGLLVSPGAVEQVQQLVRLHGADASFLPGIAGADVRAAYAMLIRSHYDLVVAGSVAPEQIATAYILANHPLYLQAISLGAVFFGACTYIGNGPNFMVKSIAEQSGVRCPSFFAYIIRYALPVLLPLFVILWLLFFRS